MPGPLKVLFLNSCINGGGAGRSLEAILNVADPRLEPIVAMPAPGVLASRLNGVAKLVYVNEFVERLMRSPYAWPDRLRMPWLHLAANAYALPRAVRRLQELVESVQPDVIHCNHMLAKPLGVALGNRTATPVVFHSRACHQLWIDAMLYDWLGRRAIVRKIICNSEASARVYRRHSAHKVTIIPNSIDINHYSRERVQPELRRRFGISDDEFVVGFVGRIHPKKGVDWLLRAFATFSRYAPRARLAIVGGNDGSLHYDAIARYAEAAARLGIGENVIFTGYQDDVHRYVADFDVLAAPSVLPESFGRVLIEAMALEVPVVTAAHGGAVEVMRDGVDGLWVALDDDEGLAQALRRIFEDPGMRRTMASNGRDRARACYEPTGVAHRVYDVLIEAAAGSRGRQ